MRGIGGHGHNDVLSFDLWAAGAPAAGRLGHLYLYRRSRRRARLMRSTAAHNALRVDGQETSRLGGEPLAVADHQRRPSALIEWASDAAHDLLIAEHDGYRRLAAAGHPSAVLHLRKAPALWRIDDELDGAGEHLVELFFHPARATCKSKTAPC